MNTLKFLTTYRDGGDTDGSAGIILAAVAEQGAMTCTALADHCGAMHGNVTGAKDKLVKAGLVEEVRDQLDRRRVLVEATRKGKAHVRRAVAAAAAAAEEGGK